MFHKLQRCLPRVLSTGLCAAVCAGQVSAQVPAERAPLVERVLPAERVLLVDLLDNGSGLEVVDAPIGDPRALLVPWWIASGTPRSEPCTPGALELKPGAALTQPFAAFGPLAADVVIRGRVAGQGRVRWIDGRGDELSLAVRDQTFEISGAQFIERFQRAPQPRFQLEISAPSESGGASFTELRALVPLPLPAEAQLRAELLELCGEVFKNWLERGVDRDGSRKTMFLTSMFDAVTGERLRVDANGIHPLYEALLDAAAISDNAVWSAALADFLRDFFELTFHPHSAMPRDWDGELDLPQDAKAIEVARYLSFLLDVCERGPTEFRARALGQAERMAETILARGVLSDDAIAVKYVPADGTPSLAAAPIRKMDVAAQLARLGGKNKDGRLVRAAAAALAELEFTHYWGGSWDRIDPDFDDSYGNWGAKATTMLTAHPGHPVFARFTQHGFEHFAPLWMDALRFGGSVAADQTRCWEFLLRYSDVEPSARATLDRTLHAALRAHVKGEQYSSGAWGDVTFASFSPRASLNVGDFTGFPANLVGGLACAYRRGSATRNEETLALFTAVLRNSKATYGRKYGWIITREEAPGQNYAWGDVRMLMGAVEMLKNLER